MRNVFIQVHDDAWQGCWDIALEPPGTRPAVSIMRVTNKVMQTIRPVLLSTKASVRQELGGREFD